MQDSPKEMGPDEMHGYSDEPTTKQSSEKKDKTGSGVDSETVAGLQAVSASKHAPNKLVATDKGGLLPLAIIPPYNGSTGAGSAALGANCPASTTTAPYTWLTLTAPDGSTIHVPGWK